MYFPLAHRPGLYRRPLIQDFIPPAFIHICRCHVIQRFVIPLVVIVMNPLGNRPFQLPGVVVIFRFMKIMIMIASCLFLLSACASATMISTPSGKPGYSINCSGTAVSVSKCYEKAGEVCPYGYNVLASHNNPGTMTNIDGSVIATSDKGMMIECK